MSVSHGKKEKVYVKVFHCNVSDVENEVNEWLCNNEGVATIINIELSIDNQSKAVVMIIYHKQARD